MYQIVLCANNTTIIKTDIAYHLIDPSVLGEGGGSIWINILQFSVKNTLMKTPECYGNLITQAIREDFLKEVTCNCDLRVGRS